VLKKFNPAGAGSAGGWLLVDDEWNAQLVQRVHLTHFTYLSKMIRKI